jgi:hypothetical protein
MTMKRALGVMLLVLLACGSGGDTRDDSAGRGSKAAGKEELTLEDRFVWGDESQTARDLDADAVWCEARAAEDPSVSKGAHPLVRIAAFVECMEELGWERTGR